MEVYQSDVSNFSNVVVLGTAGIKDTHTASLYELAFIAAHRPMLRS